MTGLNSNLPDSRGQTGTKDFPGVGKEHPSRGQTSQKVTVIMNIIHECRAQRANEVLRRPFKITGLTKFLGVFLILGALSSTVQAASVTLAWNRSADPSVTGYNLYYGGTSGTYTNKMSAGLATSAVTSGLLVGVTYYFAATTHNAAGLESPFSSAVPYLVPTQPQRVLVRAMPAGQFALTVTGTVGHTYNIQATQDFKTWTIIGTVTVDATGSLNFTDTNAPSFSRRFYRTQG